LYLQINDPINDVICDLTFKQFIGPCVKFPLLIIYDLLNSIYFFFSRI
jgi:hypothetical protein